MVQAAMFDVQGNATPEAQASGVAAACSAEAHGKVDAARLARLVEQEYLLFPQGAIGDEIVYRLQGMGMNVDYLSIRPRVSELKAAGLLVATGRRRLNKKGNTCSVLVHRDFCPTRSVYEEVEVVS